MRTGRPRHVPRTNIPELRELFALQDELQISNAALAERAGVPKTRVSDLRRGKIGGPYLVTYLALAGALGRRVKLEKL